MAVMLREMCAARNCRSRYPAPQHDRLSRERNLNGDGRSTRLCCGQATTTASDLAIVGCIGDH
jgi:hypothetical protein